MCRLHCVTMGTLNVCLFAGKGDEDCIVFSVVVKTELKTNELQFCC